MDMKEMGVTEWRSSLGELRQGGEVVAINYRNRPAALMIPIPPDRWENADPLVVQLVELRDKQIQDTHQRWIDRTREPVRLNVEEARRGSARLFGHTMNHAPVIITFYGYDNAVMLPIPPDISRPLLENIYAEVTKIVA